MSQDETVEDLAAKSPPSLHATASDESVPIAAVSTDEVPSLSQLSLNTSTPDPTNAAVEEHGTAKGIDEKQVHQSEENPEGQVTECVESVSLDPDVTQEEGQETEVHLIVLSLFGQSNILHHVNKSITHFLCVFCIHRLCVDACYQSLDESKPKGWSSWGSWGKSLLTTATSTVGKSP